MKTYGLLGYPLGHSFSRNFFKEKFEKEQIIGCEYVNFPFSDMKEAIDALRGNADLQGFNITIPHKVNILAYLDSMESVCAEIRSCNCVKVEQEKWRGFNTDVTGFENSLRPFLKPEHKKALVLGTGGASKAVNFVLQKLGIEVLEVSRMRRGKILSYSDLDKEILATHTLWVNTTPVGMAPHTEETLPLDFNMLTPDHLVYDLIYNPEKTRLLQIAEEKGAAIKNGLEMLVIQAEESWSIWNS
ncbi:MAG: shikimate dehydrogenase [Chitinophagaceae bacterium]|nr:shikimate dehydrogenase [Chitinophagaceae bacterium]